MSTQHTLSICAIFKNEAPFLREWIEYHKIVGVQHFYLYNNDSEDHFFEILKPYILNQEITLTNWPNKKTEKWNLLPFPWISTTKETAYEHAFQVAQKTSQWLIPLDLDEFLVPIIDQNITDGLKRHQNASHVQIYETIYGTADLYSIPENVLLIEALHKKTYSSYPKRNKKVIFNLRAMRNSSETTTIEADLNEFEINHYTNRYIHNFFGEKIKNKSTIENVSYDSKTLTDMLNIGNDQLDRERSILRFTPLLREKLHFPPQNPSPKTVHSFDIFDTLLGRLHYTVDSVFQIVEKKYPFPNFKRLRQLAERQCKGPKNLDNIYKEFQNITSLDESEVQKLQHFEWTVEKEHIFPIQENLSEVCHGDILVSDTYYNLDQLTALLKKVGLRKNVQTICSPDGKQTGFVWKSLSNTVKITLHTGDNYESDILNPAQYQIPSQYYENSRLSQDEQELIDLGQKDLAYLIRALRLQNPYLENSPEYLLWNEQSQINIPILIQCSLYLDQFCKAHQKNRILFSSRDTCLWIQVFQEMFPQYKSIYFHSSRYTYRHPSDSYIEYVRSMYTDDCIIVDGQGSGNTCIEFFSQHLHLHPTYLAIVHWDTAPGYNSSPELLRYGIVKVSEGWADEIEYLNNDYVGSLKGFENGTPIRLPCEFPVKYVDASHFCMKVFRKILHSYEFPSYNREILHLLMKRLKEQMISHKYLPHIKNHFPQQ